MRFLLGPALFLATGCPPDPPVTPGPTLAIGTGCLAFRDVSNGDTLPLVEGSQGLQHVWVSLRAQRISPRAAVIRMELTRISDDEVTAQPFRLRTDLVPSSTGEFSEAIGLTLRTFDPDATISGRMRLHAQIEDSGGVIVDATREVMVAWTANECLPDSGMADAAVDAATDATSDMQND